MGWYRCLHLLWTLVTLAGKTYKKIQFIYIWWMKKRIFIPKLWCRTMVTMKMVFHYCKIHDPVHLCPIFKCFGKHHGPDWRLLDKARPACGPYFEDPWANILILEWMNQVLVNIKMMLVNTNPNPHNRSKHKICIIFLTYWSGRMIFCIQIVASGALAWFNVGLDVVRNVQIGQQVMRRRHQLQWSHH